MRKIEDKTWGNKIRQYVIDSGLSRGEISELLGAKYDIIDVMSRCKRKFKDAEERAMFFNIIDRPVDETLPIMDEQSRRASEVRTQTIAKMKQEKEQKKQKEIPEKEEKEVVQVEKILEEKPIVINTQPVHEVTLVDLAKELARLDEELRAIPRKIESIKKNMLKLLSV